MTQISIFRTFKQLNHFSENESTSQGLENEESFWVHVQGFIQAP